MRAFLKISFIMSFLLLLANSPAFSQIGVEFKSADGIVTKPIKLTQQELEKSVSEKQHKAVSLITQIAAEANSRRTTAEDSEEAQYAYNGFMARLEGIRQEREDLMKKNLAPDEVTLLNYSKRLDRLNEDLENFVR